MSNIETIRHMIERPNLQKAKIKKIFLVLQALYPIALGSTLQRRKKIFSGFALCTVTKELVQKAELVTPMTDRPNSIRPNKKDFLVLLLRIPLHRITERSNSKAR